MSTVFARPSLSDLIQRVTANLQAGLQGLDPALARSVTTIVGFTLALELNNEYAYLDNLAEWFFVTTTSGVYLDRRGAEVNVLREQGATASGPVIFDGQPTSVIKAGSILQTEDSSLSYQLSNSVTLGAGGTAGGTVTALETGSAYNQQAGTALSLVVAVAGVNPQAAVDAAGITGGIDIEADAAYRPRVLARLQQPPQGGAARDYVAWAKLVPGVTRVWVYPKNRGVATVDYAFVLDGRAPGSILPTAPDIATVEASIVANYPVHVDSQNVTLTASATAVTIDNLVPASGYTKAQALANSIVSLQALFATATPGGATFGDGIPLGGAGGTTFLEAISDAITQSAGVASFDLAAPTADIVSGSGTLAQLGAVTAP